MKIKLFVLFIMAITLAGCATSSFYHLEPKEFDEIDYGFTVKKVQVRNINVAVVDEGEGETTLLLVHGLGSYIKGWKKNIPELSKRFRVIAVDLPGYGKSDKEAYPYSLSFYAQVLTELLDKMGVEKAVFVGHSMGGQISMITALNYPDKVEKLVLISPAGFERFTDGEGGWFKDVMTEELVFDTPIRSIDVNLRSNFYDTPEDALFMVTDRIQIKGAKDFRKYCYAVSRNVGAMIDEPTWDKLDQIQQPALILFGENDQLIPNRFLHGGFTKDIAELGRKGIKDNVTMVFGECGHFVQFEKSDETNNAIIEFVEK